MQLKIKSKSRYDNSTHKAVMSFLYEADKLVKGIKKTFDKKNNHHKRIRINSSGRNLTKNRHIRCIIKASFSFRNHKAHIKYITREGAGKDGRNPELYHLTNDKNIYKGVQYRFIISPEISMNEAELKDISEKVKNILESHIEENALYSVMSSIHFNTKHPHIHLVLNIENKKQRFNKHFLHSVLRKGIEYYINTKYGYYKRNITRDKKINIRDIINNKIKKCLLSKLNIDKETIDILNRNNLIEINNNEVIFNSLFYKIAQIQLRFPSYIKLYDKYKGLKILSPGEEIEGKVEDVVRMNELNDKNVCIVSFKGEYYFIPLKNIGKIRKNIILKVKNTTNSDLSILPTKCVIIENSEKHL